MMESNEALEQIKVFISAGGYAPGDRLPSERELIECLGMPRTALRKGLDALEREGAIWRHVGKGTFVAAPETSGAFPRLSELSLQVTPVQMMRARLSLEPAIAREAAANASAEAVIRIQVARDRARDANNWDMYEAADDVFHRSLAEATGNILLLSLFDHLNQVRRAVTWKQVVRQTDRPGRDHPSFAEHEVLVAAIEARDPVAAYNAMRKHLGSVSARLFGDI